MNADRIKLPPIKAVNHNQLIDNETASQRSCVQSQCIVYSHVNTLQYDENKQLSIITSNLLTPNRNANKLIPLIKQRKMPTVTSMVCIFFRDCL